MSSILLSALKACGVPTLLLAVGLAVASVPRDGIDHEALQAAAARPNPGYHPEARGYRFPDPGDYARLGMPWIKSREDFIAHLTRGEDPEVVRRYAEGPEEELIEYLGEVSARRGSPYLSGTPDSSAD
jgi:hypothetical protein